MEKVYVITRYVDNNEDPEDENFRSYTEVFRVIKSVDDVERFFTNGITSHDILGKEYDNFDIMSVEYVDRDDGYTISASYFCKEKDRKGNYYDNRVIIFKAHEMEVWE